VSAATIEAQLLTSLLDLQQIVLDKQATATGEAIFLTLHGVLVEEEFEAE
jgi:hypothetical protein